MSDRDTVADVKARLLDAEDEHSEGVMAAILDHLLRLHAHELAEELRGFGMEDAGDFIDPEVR
ncbi:hypothetical protein ACFWRC_19530 [Streptomyces albidoflavus]